MAVPLGGGMTVGPQQQNPWEDVAKNFIGAYQAFKTTQIMEKEAMLIQQRLEWDKKSKQITSTYDVLDKAASMMDGGWAQIAREMPDALNDFFQSAGVSPQSSRTLVSQMSSSSPGLLENVNTTLSAGIRSSFTTDKDGSPGPQDTTRLNQQIQALLKQTQDAMAAEQQAAQTGAEGQPTQPKPAAPVTTSASVSTPGSPAITQRASIGTVLPSEQGTILRPAVAPSSPSPPRRTTSADIVPASAPPAIAAPAAKVAEDWNATKEKLLSLQADLQEYTRSGKSTPKLEEALQESRQEAKREQRLRFSGPINKRISTSELEVMVSNADKVLDRDSVLMAFGGVASVTAKAGKEASAQAEMIKAFADLQKEANESGKIDLDWAKLKLSAFTAESMDAYRKFLMNKGEGTGPTAALGKVYMEMLKQVIEKSTPEKMEQDILSARRNMPDFGAWLDQQVKDFAKANGLTVTDASAYYKKPWFLREWFGATEGTRRAEGPTERGSKVPRLTIQGVSPGAAAQAAASQSVGSSSSPPVQNDQLLLQELDSMMGDN